MFLHTRTTNTRKDYDKPCIPQESDTISLLWPRVLSPPQTLGSGRNVVKPLATTAWLLLDRKESSGRSNSDTSGRGFLSFLREEKAVQGYLVSMERGGEGTKGKFF